MRVTKQFRIPQRLPPLWLQSPDAFVLPENATVAQWREAKRGLPKAFEMGGCSEAGARAIRRMVKIADAFALPDNVVLLPRLRALAAKGVVALRLTDRKEKADAE